MNTPDLPYVDDKPQGAADFYAAVNATFRFIARRLGPGELRRYWQQLGQGYMAPVTQHWRQGGLQAVADYWRAFFAAEPGAEVQVSQQGGQVLVSVQACPAIAYLRARGRDIFPGYCEHCYFVSQAAGAGAGVEVRVKGGNGSCCQRFAPAGSFPEPQNLEDILPAS